MDFSLESINLSSFDTKNVKGMSMMFYGCKNLASLNVSNFHTNKVENMGGIFGKCLKLKTIDIRNFDDSNLIIQSNLLNEVSNEGDIYYNSKIFNASLLNYSTIKNWNKIDVSNPKLF